MARQKVQKAVIGFLCLCTVLMFSMNFTCPEIDNTYGWLYSVLENLRLSINKDMFQLTIYWGALFYCNIKLLNLKYEKCYGIYVLNLILALFWLFSESLQIDNTFNHITGQSGQVVKSLIYVIGAVHLLNCIAILVRYILARDNINEEKETTNKLILFYRKHNYLSLFVLILLVWMPNTILSHPASMEYDVWDSVMMYFGDITFTSHHPVVFTVLIGYIAKLGYEHGNINVALFIWVIIQTVIEAAIMAYAIYTLKKNNTPKWFVVLTCLIAFFSPYYISYICTIVKDSLYSFAVLLYVVELFWMHVDWKKFWKSWNHILLFDIATLIMMLFRHNGKYIIGMMFVYILIKFILQHKEYKKIIIARNIVFILIPVIFSIGSTEYVINKYDVVEQVGEGMREALSIPFQQTARYAKYYGDETPLEEKTAIDMCIDYYCMADVYEPIISDPVKGRFHREATREQWIEYFKVWLTQFMRHPATYFGATFNQNYFIIYPMQENIRLYPNAYVDYFWDHDFLDKIGVQKDMTFEKMNQTRLSYYQWLQVFPITGVMSCLGVYNILLLYLIVYAIHDKKKNYFGVVFPVIISNLVVIAGPCIYDNIRYALPIIYAMPVVTAYFMYIYTERNNKEM